MSQLFIRTLDPARNLAALIALVSVLTASGCATEGSDQGPFVSPLLDNERENSATIGVDGGSVQASGADGTQYTLTIPADALVADTVISLTPVLDIPDLPMSGGLAGAVHFEPSGLELQRAATLAITPPSALALGDEELLTGFVYEGDGDNLDLELADTDGASFTVPVLHFSGAGAGAATPSDLEAAFAPGTADAFLAEITEALNPSNTQAVEAALTRWYQQRIKPSLQAAVSNDPALERALREYRRWLTAASFVAGLVDTSELRSESQSLAAAAFNDAIARANDLCLRQQSFFEAEKAMLWQRRAESVLPAELLLTNGLDRDSVAIELCVQVVYQTVSFPEAPITGEPETLRLVVGFAFGDGPIELASGMAVNVFSIGALPAGTTTVTDAAGEVALALTPEGGNLRIEVDACIGLAPGAGALTGAFICQEAFIVRGLSVSPARVTLSPGGRQQFTAELLGFDEPVSWSANDGSIDADGLFVASGASGTVTITASSLANPSLTASAEVTIEVIPSDFPVFEQWAGSVAIERNDGSIFPREGRLVTSYDPSTGVLEARSCETSGGDCLNDGSGCDALWEGTVSGKQMTITQVNHTGACAIGRPGQNRLYGCTLTATLSNEPDGTVRLAGSGDGSFFSCGSNVTFDLCVGGCPE